MASKNKLKGVMAESGYNNRTLSSKVGMSYSSFCAKASGKRPFTLEEAVKICDALEITDPALKCQIFLA